VDEVISELNLALRECRAHIALRNNDSRALEHLAEAASKIEHALKLLSDAATPHANCCAPSIQFVSERD